MYNVKISKTKLIILPKFNNSLGVLSNYYDCGKLQKKWNYSILRNKDDLILKFDNLWWNFVLSGHKSSDYY